MTQVVLFVDDEPMVLDSINRMLHKESYTVKTASSGEDALKIIQENSPSVIVTDMCMPFMDGNEFLSKAQQICPDSIYMVLSAYSDIGKIMKAVNEQHVWRYITKPWQKEDLKLAVENAFEMFEHRREKKNFLSKLETQNKKLIDLNDILEKKVRERTALLNDKNEILHMLVEDTDIGAILLKICKSISKQYTISPVFIDVPFLKSTFSDVPQNLSEDLLRLRDYGMEKKCEIFNNDGLCIPLIKNEMILGTILIAKPQAIDGASLIDESGSFVSIAILCLMQAWNLQQVDRMMDEIKLQ